jgi:hypothetical protein
MNKNKPLPWRIEYPKMCFPTIMSCNGMVGSVLTEKDAEYIAKACNEYPVLLEKIRELENKDKK